MAEETDELTTASESQAISDPGAVSPRETEGSEQTEAIKARIEDTRQQMGETIDAIQEKLSIANISEQVSEQVTNVIETATGTVYDVTIGKAVTFMKDMGDGISGSAAVKTIRNNPLPFIMIAAGAGMLAYNSYKGKNGGSPYAPNRRRPAQTEAKGSSRSLLGSAGEKVSGAARGMSDAAGSAYETVSNAASSTYEGITNSAGNAYSSANELAHRAYDKVGEYGRMAHDKYDTHIEENPLAVGAVALALGAAVGFAIPSTRYEGDLMGSASQNLIQKAQDSAGNLVERVKQAAEDTGENLKAGLKDSGVIH